MSGRVGNWWSLYVVVTLCGGHLFHSPTQVHTRAHTSARTPTEAADPNAEEESETIFLETGKF